MNDEIIENGILTNGLFILNEKSTIMNMDVNVKRKIEKVNNSYLWHCRLGHIREERIQKLHKGGYLDLFDYESFVTCESYLTSKMTNPLFSGTGERATELLELIHTDVCGPMSI